MKKILFATTALVATAGAASAEIALTGWAEMGIVGGSAYNDETQFHTDIDVTFTMSGEADNGLTFGANVDLDENGAFGTTTQGGEVIFVAYGNAKLSMGDVDGAFDAAMQEVNIGGSIDDAETAHGGFNGNAGLDGFYDGQIAQFAYSFNDFTAYLSVELDDNTDKGTVFDDLIKGDPVWGVGVKYKADLSSLTLGVGLGYQAVSYGAFEASMWGLSLDTTFTNGLQARVNYSAYDDNIAGDFEHMALGLGYSMNALTIGVNYGKYDFGGGVESDGYGLAVDYDLGGGLQAQLGYGNSTFTAGGVSVDSDQFSLGLRMDF